MFLLQSWRVCVVSGSHKCVTCFRRMQTESGLAKAPAQHTSESVRVVSELWCAFEQEDTTGMFAWTVLVLGFDQQSSSVTDLSRVTGSSNSSKRARTRDSDGSNLLDFRLHALRLSSARGPALLLGDSSHFIALQRKVWSSRQIQHHNVLASSQREEHKSQSTWVVGSRLQRENTQRISTRDCQLSLTVPCDFFWSGRPCGWSTVDLLWRPRLTLLKVRFWPSLRTFWWKRLAMYCNDRN